MTGILGINLEILDDFGVPYFQTLFVVASTYIFVFLSIRYCPSI